VGSGVVYPRPPLSEGLIVMTDVPPASPNGAAPPSDETKPMVVLDPAGTPTPLSYNVPEPMAYSGRNFIIIDLPRDAFATPMIDPEQILALIPAPKIHADGAALDRAARDSAEDFTVVSDPTEAVTVLSDPAATMTAELAGLARHDARLLAPSAQRAVLVTNSAGLLDYRLVDGAVLGRDRAVRHGALAGGGTVAAFQPEDGPEPPEPPEPPTIRVFLDTPAAGSSCQGSSHGVTIPVSGRWNGEGFRGSPAITLSVDGQAETPLAVDSGTWSGSAALTTSGQHILTVRAKVTGATWRGRVLTGRDSASAAIAVALSADPKPAPVLPTITIDEPRPNRVVAAPSGQASLTVRGRASITPPAPLTVTVADATTGGEQHVALPAGVTDYSVDFPLAGLGLHQLQAIATTGDDVASAEATARVTLSLRPESRRITNKLMIVETMNITSYLGAYGAGRVLKTFSLLPGERTTISIKSYRNDVETSKQAASILDSAATEASHDFDDTISAEQSDKTAAAQASEFKVGATASASWGFGSASINASYSGSANSAREEAVKKVSTATRKHASKASTNRSVTVNTETASTLTSTQDDSTVRELTNINVSRTLNFVFRQMNQEHIVLYHLTNARIAYYTEDIPLDADGSAQRDTDGKIIIQRTYQEVSLPELNSLLDQILDPARYTAKVHDAVVNALSGIPDYTDELRSLVETATPRDADGEAVVEAAYLRVVRNLRTTFQDPFSSFTVDVPGIVLAFDHIVQRTEGVFVDAILGQGEALDAYSRGLQEAAVAERRAAATKTELAAHLVDTHDDAGASIYQKVFPPPATAPVPQEG
jgi:hypothetical protein